MNWSLSVLSSHSADTQPSIVVTFDSAKYIFNTGENTTRAFLQSPRRWNKMRALFFSRLDAERGMGLPGFLMTLADGGIKRVSVVGPQGLLHFLASMRLYLYRDTISVNPIQIPLLCPTGEGEELPVYKDENMSIYALRAFPRSFSASATSTPSSSTPADTTNTSGMENPSESTPVQNFLKRKHPPSSSTSSSLARQIPESFLKAPHPHPEALRGQEREWWRWMVVGRMFKPFDPKQQDQVQSGPKKKKGRKEDPSLDDALSGVMIAVANNNSTSTCPNGASVSASGNKGVVEDMGEGPHPKRATAPPEWYKRLPVFSLRDLSSPSPHPNRSSFSNRPKLALNTTSQPPGAENPGQPTLSYLLVGPRVRGKFNAARAEELGLGPGPGRARLARGETVTITVTLPDGTKEERVIRPEDCVGETEQVGVVLILDIPTPAHIPSLLHQLREGVCARVLEKTKEYNVRAVIHILGGDVLDGGEGERLWKEVLLRFDKETHHLVSSPKHTANRVAFTSAAYAQMRLNVLDPDMFPSQQFKLEPEISLSSIPDVPTTVEPLLANTLVSIRPPRPPVLDPEAEERDPFHPCLLNPAENPILSDQTRESFEKTREEVRRREGEMMGRKKPGDDVVVMPLGTSSAAPTKVRNVSGTLLQIPNYGSILLDTGEGTYGQLARAFGLGSEGVDKVLRELRCVFVSHVHADHHVGLARVLAERAKLCPRPEPLYIVAGHPVLLYLSEYSDLEELGMNDGRVVTVPADGLLGGQVGSESPALQGLYNALGLQRFEIVSVRHRIRCFGCVVEHRDAWSIVYSGDTMPSDYLIAAGQNATLLIHEATMADEEAELALAKAHSTIGQAVDVGKQMNAENILLTHFSARYPKMPPSLTSESTHPTIAVAFDHARIRIGDMWKLKAYLPAIEGSFEESEDTDEEVLAVIDQKQSHEGIKPRQNYNPAEAGESRIVDETS
ncbi:hypothetical protein NEOLEDRAFT_1172230 [Neolentinus lepideus HHB14362 ss-1]|uniref:ribonuclease Z n=1 Tax=Neolentinus lepideus HHB14362 ss-1 TaxID=1314782 RepID=A0A165PE76_9AGAM|nr:hypothetical protein NEOLEDRAFT_1172230 [Neolentinus lepideus HHB14362 ss-1]